MPRTEIYYISDIDLTANSSQVNYVELNSELPFVTYSINSQTKMYSQDGIYSGKYYTNKNIQINEGDNSSNSTLTNTISIKNKGIIFFLRSYDATKSIPGYITVSEPTYQSGVYLGKDMQVIVEDLKNEEKTLKITFVISD